MRIASDGTLTVNGKKLGQIQLVTVTSPDHLRGEGGSLLDSDRRKRRTPCDQGAA